MTTVLDGVGEGSGKACWALMRGARADMFGFARRGKIFQLHHLAAEKTGQVLVRTRPHPGAREPQRFQSLMLAMSGGLYLDQPLPPFTLPSGQSRASYACVDDGGELTLFFLGT